MTSFKPRFAAAALIAVLAGVSTAQAATYLYRTYIPGFSPAAAPPAAPITPAAEAIVLALTGDALPAATNGRSYSYDLASLLGVTGDATYSPAQVAWSGGAGLPSGLTLNPNGTITGTPTVVGGA